MSDNAEDNFADSHGFRERFTCSTDPLGFQRGILLGSPQESKLLVVFNGAMVAGVLHFRIPTFFWLVMIAQQIWMMVGFLVRFFLLLVSAISTN